MQTEIARKNEVRDALASRRIKLDLADEIEIVAELAHSVGYLLRSQQNGIFNYGGKPYLIDYAGTTRGKLLEINKVDPKHEIRLSFRSAKKGYGLFPVVLVSEYE